MLKYTEVRNVKSEAKNDRAKRFSNVKRFINELLEKYSENSDMSDEAFKSLYSDTAEAPNDMGIFSIPSPIYKPSYPFAKRTFTLPWQKS